MGHSDGITTTSARTQPLAAHRDISVHSGVGRNAFLLELRSRVTNVVAHQERQQKQSVPRVITLNASG